MSDSGERGLTTGEMMDQGFDYCYFDEEAKRRKIVGATNCWRFNQIGPDKPEESLAALKEIFGSCGERVSVQQRFSCYYGKNIHLGEDFLANYNVSIQDTAPVHIGRNCLIGPHTVLTTTGHPLSPAGRRAHLATSAPITIGDDVWIGANCTIIGGVTIGNNVVVAAGAVVIDDLPDNCLAAGVPARVIKEIPNDLSL